MFRAFNLIGIDWKQFPTAEGERINAENKTWVTKALQEFLNSGKIDGSALRDHWFPAVQADIFISHAHEDNTDALKWRFAVSSG